MILLKDNIKLCNCGEEIILERYNLGYKICTYCGEQEAKIEVERRKSCIAPLYNKGAYQYIGSIDQVLTIGKK